jgi:hypothetical protein
MRASRSKFRFINKLAGLIVLASALPALAGEGRVPLYQATTITSPGRYVVTRNISSAGIVLTINAGDVEIDMNGFVLRNAAGGAVITSNGFNNITLRNGTLLNGGDGVVILNAEKVHLEELRCVSQTGFGIYLESVTDFTLRGNKVLHAGADGIRVDAAGAAAPVQGSIEHNLVEDVDSGIVLAGGTSVSIRNNRVHQTNGAAGIQILDSSVVSVTDNTIKFSATQGLFLSNTASSLLARNVIDKAATHGIELDNATFDSRVVGNVAASSGRFGLFVGGARNHLESNVLNANTDWGLMLAPPAANNVFRGNTVMGNTGLALCGLVVAPNNICDDGAGDHTGGDNFTPIGAV